MSSAGLTDPEGLAELALGGDPVALAPFAGLELAEDCVPQYRRVVHRRSLNGRNHSKALSESAQVKPIKPNFDFAYQRQFP